MELLIIIVIIVVLCLVLNISINYILFGCLVLSEIFFGLMTIGFAYCIIRLLLSKRSEGKFIRFDKTPKGKLQVAYYLVGDEEYPCAFPKEFIMENKLYLTDKIYNVMLDSKKNKVYDRYAITTCVLGFIFSVFFCVGMILFLHL